MNEVSSQLTDKYKVDNITHPALRKLIDEFGLNPNESFQLNHTLLNKRVSAQLDFRFVSQSELPENEYYESFIYRTKKIPTRYDSWHDFLNGLVWYQFPKTKQLLNHLHVRHISENGLRPRGALRDRITHFDECGLVIYWREIDPTPLLRMHSWQQLFIEKRERWFADWQPVIFGHALYEILLKPHIGITAKTLCIQCDNASTASNSIEYDGLLSNHIMTRDTFNQKRSLLPLPLLGIPGWHFAEQNAEFYNDKNYFMPKRVREKTSE